MKLHNVNLLNPHDLEPRITHRFAIGTPFRINGVPGEVLERGYTVPGHQPVYGLICDDNVERTFVEEELQTDRVEAIEHEPEPSYGA